MTKTEELRGKIIDAAQDVLLLASVCRNNEEILFAKTPLFLELLDEYAAAAGNAAIVEESVGMVEVIRHTVSITPGYGSCFNAEHFRIDGDVDVSRAGVYYLIPKAAHDR